MKVHTLLRTLLDRRGREVLRQRDRVVRTGGKAAVHDLRVATRRLQEALEFFGPLLPSGRRRRLVRRARRIRRALGDVRNADVIVDLVRSLRRRAGSARDAGLTELEGRLAGEARALRRRAAGRKGLPVPGIRRRLRALMRRLPTSPPSPLPPRAQRVLRGRAGEIRGALAEAATGRAEALHRLRIAIKRYRYALEIVEAAGLAGARAQLAAARGLQTALGDLHDLDVLIDLVRGGATGRGGAALLRRLRADRRARLAEVLRDVAELRRTRLARLAVAPGRVEAAA